MCVLYVCAWLVRGKGGSWCLKRFKGQKIMGPWLKHWSGAGRGGFLSVVVPDHVRLCFLVWSECALQVQLKLWKRFSSNAALGIPSPSVPAEPLTTKAFLRLGGSGGYLCRGSPRPGRTWDSMQLFVSLVWVQGLLGPSRLKCPGDWSDVTSRVPGKRRCFIFVVQVTRAHSQAAVSHVLSDAAFRVQIFSPLSSHSSSGF